MGRDAQPRGASPTRPRAEAARPKLPPCSGDYFFHFYSFSYSILPSSSPFLHKQGWAREEERWPADLTRTRQPRPRQCTGHTLGFQAPCQERAGTLRGTLAELPARSGGVGEEGGVGSAGRRLLAARSSFGAPLGRGSHRDPAQRPWGRRRAGRGAGKRAGGARAGAEGAARQL